MHTNFTVKGVLILLLLMASELLSAQSAAETIATDHLRQNLATLNLTEADLSNYVVTDEVLTKHNGVTSIYLRQKYQEVEVFNAVINVNILPSNEILSFGNKFIPNVAEKVNTTVPQISMLDAIRAVQNEFEISETYVPTYETERLGDFDAYFSHSGLALEPIRVKLIFQPLEDNEEVRLAWNVTYYELDAQNWWNARVDALTGEVLHHYNHVIHCDFGVPDANCTLDHSHGTAHVIKETTTNFLAPPPTTNAYNVYAIPLETPNHGDQTLEINPANLTASPFGWHDVDGEPGHEFTITRGNNVHAYHDIFNQNESTGNEPDGGDSLVFDFPYDEMGEFPYQQLDAATTNLFYWNNVTHDLWYQYGFDEASGNFQENNYGNGGVGGDYVRAEALDGSGTNNANFATPEEGNRPRMQMYRWGGNGGTGNDDVEITFDVLAPASVAGEYEYVQMGFGGELPGPDDDPIVSQVVLVDDGTGGDGNPADACDDILNGADIAGKIAMVDRGNCQFGAKVLACQEEGAIAVIICEHQGDPIFSGGGGVAGGAVTIPAIMVSLVDCNEIKMGLPDLEVALQVSGDPFQIPDPGPTGRDSDLDNGVIVHEYGHGISIRLTGGPNNSGCLQNQEQQGEGWSDWFALVMQTSPQNFAEQGRGIGTYLQFQPITGGGIRQYRYSRDMDINPHTYGATPNVAVPHGVGSIWCVMIWDLYWNMVDIYGFDEDLYNGTGGNNMTMQLVLDGLKLQPCNPDFTEARDAIIAADIANYDGEHVCLIWETFARRGLGFSATPGGNEAYDTPPLCLDAVRVFKTAATAADAGSTLTYTLEIINGTPENIPNAVITDTLPAGVTFVEGSLSCGGVETIDNGILSIDLGTLNSEDILTCTYEVEIATEPFSFAKINDDLENFGGDWDKEAGIGDEKWTLSTEGARSGQFSYVAENVDFASDQYLYLEEEFVLTGNGPFMSFWHIYDTENQFDGGVVEITTDSGTTWTDLGPFFTQNGYNSIISPTANTPLAGKMAFTGSNGGEYIESIVDLADFAGETVNIRLRFATDDENGAFGWQMDDFVVFGDFHSITNVACITDEDGEEQCSEVTTVVFGEEPNSTISRQLDANINLFPNPASQEVVLQITDAPSEKATLTIRSIDGRVLLNQKMNAVQAQTIDLNGFAAGLYFVEILLEEGLAVRKLVVE